MNSIKTRIASKETRLKMSLAHRGKKLSEEHKKKISKAHTGKKRAPFSVEWRRKMSAWQTGIKRKPLSKEHKQKVGDANRGRVPSKETRKKISIANTGKKFTLEHRLKLSRAQSGEKGSNWKGGISNVNNVIRRSIEFCLWREAVFIRDDWTCQKTGVRGKKLHPHHIKNFSQYPELRFAIDNGITLSDKAHREFHKKYGKQNNTIKQLEEYIERKLK